MKEKKKDNEEVAGHLLAMENKHLGFQVFQCVMCGRNDFRSEEALKEHGLLCGKVKLLEKQVASLGAAISELSKR